MEIKTFKSFDEMREFMTRNSESYEKAYRRKLQNKELPDFKDGDLVYRNIYDLQIIGVLSNPMDWYKDKVLGKDYDECDYGSEKEMHENQLKSGYVFGRFASKACPEGELGYAPVTELMVISKEHYDIIAKYNGVHEI